ncbi:MAG: ferric reductase-like transmembrane domain-containing protein [bacterium]
MIGTILIWLTILFTMTLFGVAKIQFFSLSPSIWQIFAQISGLMGLLLLSWSFVLSIRNLILEKMFGGLDKVYKIHHIVGGASFLFLINHPLFLIINSLPSNLLKLYLIPGTMLDYNSGILALYLMLLLLLLTLFVDLPYYLWKQTHEWMGMVIFLGGMHGLLISSDMSRFMPLRIWMLGFSLVAILSFLYKRYLYYFLLPNNNYRLIETRQDGDVIIISMSSTDPKKSLIFAPGQFAFLSVVGSKRDRDEHPFSVLLQDGDVVQFGIKAFGQFTSSLLRLPTNASLTLRGPFGRFGEAMGHTEELVFIAGGIGITPFISMAKSLQSNQKATLFHISKGTCSPYISEMLNLIVSHFPNFQFIEYDSRLGRITGNNIIEHTKYGDKAKYLICGPVPMMESLSDQLVSLGIAKNKIVYEDFNFK